MSYQADAVHVSYCCSDLFAEVCAVSLVSLYENNKHIPEIHAYIIDDGIGAVNKQRIISMAEGYHREVTFIPLPDPAKFYKDERFTIKTLGHTFARLLLGDLLPENIDRVISLDSDTIVLDKIDDLWATSLDDFPVAGVDDCMGRVALVKTQHLSEDALHCNAGMLLMNLKVWREEGWSEKFYQYIKQLFDKNIALGGYEEEVMNHVINGRMKTLHPRFNLMTLEQVFSYKELLYYRGPLHYYSDEEINAAKKQPVITHTTNLFYVKKRVFEENSDHPMRKQYEKYRQLTPWKGEPAMTMNPTPKQKLMKNFWHMMPRKLSICVARFVRNEIRPRLTKKRDDE